MACWELCRLLFLLYSFSFVFAAVASGAALAAAAAAAPLAWQWRQSSTLVWSRWNPQIGHGGAVTCSAPLAAFLAPRHSLRASSLSSLSPSLSLSPLPCQLARLPPLPSLRLPLAWFGVLSLLKCAKSFQTSFFFFFFLSFFLSQPFSHVSLNLSPLSHRSSCPIAAIGQHGATMKR